MTLLVVSVHAAPTMTLEDRRLSSPPKWVNPCGLAAEDFTGDLDVVQLTDSQLLHQVVVQAKTALMHAELFRDDYVSIDCTFINFLYRFVRARARTHAAAKHYPDMYIPGIYLFDQIYLGRYRRSKAKRSSSSSMVR